MKIIRFVETLISVYKLNACSPTSLKVQGILDTLPQGPRGIFGIRGEEGRGGIISDSILGGMCKTLFLTNSL